MECGKSTGELEGNKKPLGVLSGFAVLAASDWFRAFVFGNDAAFLKEVALSRNTRTTSHHSSGLPASLPLIKVVWFL